MNTYQYEGQWRDQWLTTENSDHQPTENKRVVYTGEAEDFEIQTYSNYYKIAECLDYFQQNIVSGLSTKTSHGIVKGTL